MVSDLVTRCLHTISTASPSGLHLGASCCRDVRSASREEDLNHRHRRGPAARSCTWGSGNRKGRIMRRVLALVALVLATGGMLGFTAAAASADGNGATTSTQTFKNATDQFVDFVPCRDFQATITI